MMSKQALEGVKVADFSWVAAGPVSTRYLADHGATVIRVESNNRPDPLRSFPPFKDNVVERDHNAFFANYNSNKYGMGLNLRHPKGVEVAKRLVAWADVVAESFNAGVMDRLGLNYEEIRKVKPDIIMISTCNQGQTGPYALHPGYGTQLASLAGFTHLTGWPDRTPAVAYGAYTDYVTPRFAVAALVAALDYRRKTGKGQYIDVSQFECGVHFLSPVVMNYMINGYVANRDGNSCPYATPHGAYRCQGEDEWCAISVSSDRQWDSFCEVIGNPPWTQASKFATFSGRKENEDELNMLVEEWTANFTAEEVMTLMQTGGVPAGVVRTNEGVHNDPHLKERHHFWVLDHQVIGKHTYDGPAFKLSKTPGSLKMPAPCVGEHTEYVCTQILGMSDEEFVSLLNMGVFD